VTNFSPGDEKYSSRKKRAYKIMQTFSVQKNKNNDFNKHNTSF